MSSASSQSFYEKILYRVDCQKEEIHEVWSSDAGSEFSMKLQ
jgi:hypothetical protein